MKVCSLTEDAVEQAGRRQEAISAFLLKIRISVENTGKFFVARSHRQHHFDSPEPAQKLHRQSGRSAPGQRSSRKGNPAARFMHDWWLRGDVAPSVRTMAQRMLRRAMRTGSGERIDVSPHADAIHADRGVHSSG